MFRDSGIRIRGLVPEFALFLRDLVQNYSRTTVVDTTSRSEYVEHSFDLYPRRNS